MLAAVAKPNRAKMGQYGESKKRFQVMLTSSLMATVDAIAEESGVTRSEALERVLRSLDRDEMLRRIQDAGE